ncbi:MAG: sensor histidine kinase [Alphaproteobacteria bacterium]|nr:sensor histidine kinase [Alphaproteobacteria bacterium]
MADQSTPSLPEKQRRSLLTDATKRVDIIHTTLVGMAGIVLLLYAAALLPVMGKQPVTDVKAAIVMGIAAFGGICVLAYMNYTVHKQVTEHARLTEVLVNSLGQGFLSFNKAGLCGPMYSQACLDMLETAPAGQHIADVLKVARDSREDFVGWLEVLYDQTHALGFDDAVRFLPQGYVHGVKRNICLEYKPIRNEQGALTNVVVIVTDRTEETEAQALAEQRQQFANMICKIFKERNQFITTISHVREFIAYTSNGNLTLRDMPDLMRQLHTLKGAVRHFDLLKFGSLIHEIESQIRSSTISSDTDLQLLVATAHDAIAAEFGRVLVEVRDLIGEEEEGRGNVYEIREDVIYDFADHLKELTTDQSLLTAFYKQIAAVPIRSCFLGFERELIEMAQQMDKNIKPVLYNGGSVSVLARPLQGLFFSLTHISRNIIDHGIEPPVTRLARQKDAAGQIVVEFSVEQDAWLVIRIRDDGAGIDPNRIRQKLAAMEPEGKWRFEDDQQIIQHIFGWGVSTRDGVSQVSGRGVGLEAVLREVEILGGTIAVQSEIYRGTCFMLRIPYRMVA